MPLKGMNDKIKFPAKSIEAKWQERWNKENLYLPKLESAKNPFYNLWMFPYPSAEGLHAGHAFASTGSDIYGRFMRMNGKDVFQPIGYDSFGIHSENFALKIGEHPKEMIERTTKNYEKQLRSLGHGYDWTKTVTTSNAEYYKWTQWLFIQLFKKGLAYKKRAPVNFCPKDLTVLADEQVIDGRCERCETLVEKKDLEQWFFKITEYADRLLANLNKIDWPEKIKTAQREWVGRSEGAQIEFKIHPFDKLRTRNSKFKINVFTTRPDTLFGATFLVLAPEHPIVNVILNSFQNLEIPKQVRDDTEKYVEEAKKKTEQERVAEDKDKTGVFSGLYAINPVNNEKIPVWIADYVLMGYGTGAIMAVPAHDKRDFEFAQKYNLPVIQVIKKLNVIPRSYLMGGENISDDQLQSLGIKILEKTKKGDRKLEIPSGKLTNYINLVKEKLTNGFWNEIVGDEILFIFKDKNGKIKEITLDKKTSPEIEKLAAEYNNEQYLGQTSTWKWLAENDTYTDLVIHDEPGIIINSEEWDGLKIPQDLGKIIAWLENKHIGKRQIQYHLRDWLISRQRYWGPPIPMVNCPRCGWQPVPEKDLPVLLPDVKDWKPKGTGNSPLANIESFVKTTCPKCKGHAKRETDVSDTFLDSAWYFLRYPTVGYPTENKYAFDPEVTKKWLPVNLYFGGAEHAVLHLMYSRFATMVLYDLGLLSFEEPFPKFFAHGLLIKNGAKMSKSKGNVINPDQYIQKFGADTLRLYLMFIGPMDGSPDFRDEGIEGMKRFIGRIWRLSHSNGIINEKSKKEIFFKMHQTIKKVTENIHEFKYNSAIALIMEYINTLEKHTDKNNVDKKKPNEWLDALKNLTLLIAPFAPHIAEEIWMEVLKQPFTIHKTSWPKYDQKELETETALIVIQVNGRIRGQIEVYKTDGENKETVENLAGKNPNVVRWIKQGSVKKIIFLPSKLINFVVE